MKSIVSYQVTKIFLPEAARTNNVDFTCITNLADAQFSKYPFLFCLFVCFLSVLAGKALSKDWAGRASLLPCNSVDYLDEKQNNTN